MADGAPFAAPGVVGFLHRPDHPSGQAIVLTHGAGSDCRAPLLVAVAAAFAAVGAFVLRCDLPFRQRRAKGPPGPGDPAHDRAGLAQAVAALAAQAGGVPILAGHSYGGRQASMLAADEPGIARGLVLFSYPLHPPRAPERLRTEHFPCIAVPALFVHGAVDPFGSIAELEAAVALIPAPTRILPIAGAGHDLRRGHFDLGAVIAAANDLLP